MNQIIPTGKNAFHLSFDCIVIKLRDIFVRFSLFKVTLVFHNDFNVKRMRINGIFCTNLEFKLTRALQSCRAEMQTVQIKVSSTKTHRSLSFESRAPKCPTEIHRGVICEGVRQTEQYYLPTGAVTQLRLENLCWK